MELWSCVSPAPRWRIQQTAGLGTETPPAWFCPRGPFLCWRFPTGSRRPPLWAPPPTADSAAGSQTWEQHNTKLWRSKCFSPVSLKLLCSHSDVIIRGAERRLTPKTPERGNLKYSSQLKNYKREKSGCKMWSFSCRHWKSPAALDDSGNCSLHIKILTFLFISWFLFLVITDFFSTCFSGLQSDWTGEGGGEPAVRWPRWAARVPQSFPPLALFIIFTSSFLLSFNGGYELQHNERPEHDNCHRTAGSSDRTWFRNIVLQFDVSLIYTESSD